jgi:hypothetical protein
MHGQNQETGYRYQPNRLISRGASSLVIPRPTPGFGMLSSSPAEQHPTTGHCGNLARIVALAQPKTILVSPEDSVRVAPLLPPSIDLIDSNVVDTLVSYTDHLS